MSKIVKCLPTTMNTPVFVVVFRCSYASTARFISTGERYVSTKPTRVHDTRNNKHRPQALVWIGGVGIFVYGIMRVSPPTPPPAHATKTQTTVQTSVLYWAARFQIPR